MLKGDFQSSEPTKKFLTDITEIQRSNGKLYVSAIMDCFSGEIVALETRDNMKKELSIATLNQLKNFCNVDLSGSIFRSDREVSIQALRFARNPRKWDFVRV